uniref:Guanine nucleotide-binding protein subunit beta-like protein n=1 Tax=Trypanosoma vivax (strain Y486) TaxID=1055687 RepID=G0UCU4_TRYVY|nr:conserved hypothetical protein, fragment [Trypanosoma vivax Y486]
MSSPTGEPLIAEVNATGRKRLRETVITRDIRTMFSRAREHAALKCCGPPFVERILSPHLTNWHCGVSGLLTDPTRLCSGADHGARRCVGVLMTPQRRMATTLLHHYKHLDHGGLRTVVQPAVDDIGPTLNSPISSTVVTDVVFDMLEEFAAVCQRRRLTAYSTDGWLGDASAASGSGTPLVTIEARGSTSLGFDFSSAQFISSSLHLIAGYHRASVVDVFDLEQVDEETSAPEQRFTLAGSQAGSSAHSGASAHGSTVGEIVPDKSVYANDVVPINEHVAVAALSSGLSVWLDRRSNRVETCTGAFVPRYTIGERNTHSNLKAPLTSVAFMCRNDPVNIVVGTQTGTVQLWDVRCARNFVATHQTSSSSSVCRIQPSYCPSLRGLVWLNTDGGSLQCLSVGCMEPAGLVVCPHILTNSLLFYDAASLVRCHGPGSRGQILSGGDRAEEGSSASSSLGDDDDDSTHCWHDGRNTEVTRCSTLSPLGSRKKVHKIPLAGVLNYEDRSSVSACSCWSRYSKFIVGNEVGQVQLV